MVADLVHYYTGTTLAASESPTIRARVASGLLGQAQSLRPTGTPRVNLGLDPTPRCC